MVDALVSDDNFGMHHPPFEDGYVRRQLAAGNNSRQLYRSMIRLNYWINLAQHPLKMWQYNSRCLPQLAPASWRKEQLELFPTASWRPTVTLTQPFTYISNVIMIIIISGVTRQREAYIVLGQDFSLIA